MMRVLVVGGGTGGHVVPALAVSAELKQRGAEILFVGSEQPLDRRLVERAGFKFQSIPAGKLRRYFSLRSLGEPLKAVRGYRRSASILKRFRPDVVFAKGGFVSLPVMRAAKRQKVPIVLHESDIVPGLANRVGERWADAVAVSFPPEQMKWETEKPLVFTGNPVRGGLMKGTKARAKKLFQLSGHSPVVLILGGSQGALNINRIVSDALPIVLGEVEVIHQLGERSAKEVSGFMSNLSPKLRPRYHPKTFLADELFDAYAAADLVVSRASAGGMAEVAAAGKPMILIPLPASAGGHQQANADYFAKAGAALVLDEKDLNGQILARNIKKLIHDPDRRVRMGRAARKLARPEAAKKVAQLVGKAAKGA